MAEFALKPGWLRRDVDKAVEEQKCYRMVRSLDTAELREWHAFGLKLLKQRGIQKVDAP